MILVAVTTKPHHEDVYYPQIRAYKQTPTADTCFVKVLGKRRFFPFDLWTNLKGKILQIKMYIRLQKSFMSL